MQKTYTDLPHVGQISSGCMVLPYIIIEGIRSQSRFNISWSNLPGSPVLSFRLKLSVCHPVN